MWEKRNLHENRSCCPVFRSNLCEASPWSKENGATHPFSPGWEQETADLRSLHVILQEHMTNTVAVVKLMHHVNVIYIAMH